MHSQPWQKALKKTVNLEFHLKFQQFPKYSGQKLANTILINFDQIWPNLTKSSILVKFVLLGIFSKKWKHCWSPFAKVESHQALTSWALTIVFLSQRSNIEPMMISWILCTLVGLLIWISGFMKLKSLRNVVFRIYCKPGLTNVSKHSFDGLKVLHDLIAHIYISIYSWIYMHEIFSIVVPTCEHTKKGTQTKKETIYITSLII